MRLVAVIQDERVARGMLEHLDLPARAPPRGRPWRSAGQEHLALDDPARYDEIDEPLVNCFFDVLSPARLGAFCAATAER